MKYRTFPGSDVTVSEVGFGMWTVATGWWGNKTDDEAVRMLHKAFDRGVTLYDAADTYGDGRSEDLLLKAFGDRRDRVVYATKFGYDWYNHSGERKGQMEIAQDWSVKHAKFALEQSLKRLGTDVIDIWQLHNLRMETIERDDLWRFLEDIVREGKVKIVGVALGPAIGWLYEGIRSIEKRRVKCLQIIYNLLEQHPGREQIDAGRDNETGYLIRVPHSSGMLEGKYTKDTVFPENDHRRHRPRSWLVNGVQKVETISFLTDGTGRTLGQAALKWLLAEPLIMSCLPNIYDDEQLEEFAAACETPDLTREELARVEALWKTNFGVDEPPMKFKGTMESDQTPPPLPQEELRGAAH
ncbi:MAG: aldo/keto reductase [Myxococcales bacterium]|nr:aldo/keto reductase [Myxococcales bacterium]